MQTIILAAGLGSRLGSITREMPKALVTVDGEPLIHYALRFARAVGSRRVVVVGGYGCHDVRKTVARHDRDAHVVENSEFRKGNLMSLRAGLPEIDVADGFLVMNTDHIYKPSIATVVRDTVSSANELTGFCDFDRTLTADDMKVRLGPNRRISAISKKLEHWDAGYVGMTYIPPTRALTYVSSHGALLEAQGDHIHVEAVLAHFATTDIAPKIADISGHGWLEVDEPNERDHAERVLHTERWWE